jgi:ABC-2 type transport system permease protein
MATPAPVRVTTHLVRSRRLHHNLRILRVLAAMDFKLKYSGSALGYLWSVIKPLSLFTILYLVFSRIFRLGGLSQYYPLSLLIGVVLFTFFSEATSLGMFSVVDRASLIGKMAFPRLIIPVSRTIGVAITFMVNLTVVAAFIAWNGIEPRWYWILLVPLLIEFYIFILGVTLILATLFVRLRDISQVWELTAQLIFYATPIIYPVGYLPPGLRTIAFLNPLTQVVQDFRAIVLYDDLEPNLITAADVFGTWGRLLPIGIALGIFVFGLLFYRRQAPWFAERV